MHVRHKLVCVGVLLTLASVGRVSAQEAAPRPARRPAASAPLRSAPGELVEHVTATTSHAVLRRRISVRLRDASLEEALRAITGAAGVSLAFSADILPPGARVTVELRNREFGAALLSIVEGRDLELWISRSGQLMLAPGLRGQPSSGASQAVGQVSGIITGVGNRPLVGASVIVSGTNRGGRTDAQGWFSVSAVPEGVRTIRATFAGYAEGARPVTVSSGRTATASLQLTAQVVYLEEVVAIGYGSVRRRDVTGSVASIRAADAVVKAAPTAAVANVLQGRAPGVQVVSNSGAPGAGASVRLRGSNSIAANAEPLYVVDGLPVAQGSTGTANPLASIEPSDMESIEILKDASQTAIYGARGANGVVLITTKRGQRGSNQLTLESSYGVQVISRRIDVMNGPEFMQFSNEANANANRPARYTAQDVASAQTYDYVDAILRRAPQQSHALSISGGDERTRFLVGANYLQQQGVVRGNEFNRYGFRLKLDRDVTPRFRIGNSFSLTYLLEHDPAGAEAVGTAMVYFPYVPFKDEQGNWIRDLIPFGVQGIGSNPLANALEAVNDQNAWRGIGNVYGEIDLSDALKLRTTLGGNFGFTRTGNFLPRTTAGGFTNDGSASIATGQTIELTDETTATYRRALGPGELGVLGGVSVQLSQSQGQAEAGQTVPRDALSYHNLGSTTTNRIVNSGLTDWALLSFLGRVNYNFRDRYLLAVTGRRDGSSRFGANNKWAFFPSVAVAWRAIDEEFMRRQSLFSDLKLRLSYGRTGNQAIEEYQSLSQMAIEFYGAGSPAMEANAVAPRPEAGNPDLKWETQDQFNAGVDLGVADNRVTLTADAYQSNTSDLLLVVDRRWTTGFNTQLQNVGAVRNRGVEVALSTVNVDQPGFTWRSTLNLARGKNEVLSLYGGLTSIQPTAPTVQGLTGGTNIVQVGKPLGSIIGIKTEGLYQQGDPCHLLRTSLCAPGELKAVDVNGDGDINLNDRVIVGNGDPKVYGGFSNSLTLGPVSLDAFFNFSYGNDLANLALAYNGMSRALANERKEIVNRWTPANTRTTIPRANNARDSWLFDTMVEGASFLRLQTLTLGWRLPRGVIPATKDARLYLTGQNLWLLTSYSGFDPEVNSRGGSSTLRGIDENAYPHSRSWNVGANVGF